VTAAALLSCVAVGALGASSIVFVKWLGIGTAAAVLLDETIVRALLLPALPGVLQGRTWWAPAPLRPLHARFSAAGDP
jgi:RND superfamily putative drug exporter